MDDRIIGLVIHGQKPGLKTALSSDEEESLTYYLLYVADRGFLLTKTMVKALAIADQGPSEHWWQLFRKRHSQISSIAIVPRHSMSPL